MTRRRGLGRGRLGSDASAAEGPPAGGVEFHRAAGQHVRLHDNHARAISTTLSKIEKDINEIEMYLKDPPHGRMYGIVDDLDDSEKEGLLSRIPRLRECIREFADALGLEPDQASMSGIIGARFAVDWANACDIEAERLKGYGAVDQRLAQVVDVYAERLIALLSSMR